MPVQPCTSATKPGFRWGKKGKCYPYTRGDPQSRDRARAKAAAQGRAIKASGGG